MIINKEKIKELLFMKQIEPWDVNKHGKIRYCWGVISKPCMDEDDRSMSVQIIVELVSDEKIVKVKYVIDIKGPDGETGKAGIQINLSDTDLMTLFNILKNKGELEEFEVEYHEKIIGYKTETTG
jgi:hypothetical protein